VSSAEGEACDGPARPGAPVVADFYGRRKVPGTVVEGPWNAVLSEAAGEPLRLVRASDPSAGHDEYPVTLLGEESVAELARRSGAGRSLHPRFSQTRVMTRESRRDAPVRWAIMRQYHL
jgi:hypothetical protein